MAKRRIVVTPYKNGCAGLRLVKEHSQALGITVIEKKVNGSKLKARASDINIRWGVGNGGKLAQLTKLTDAKVPCLAFSTSKKVAEEWVGNGTPVVCRTILNGHGGDGIIIADKVEDLVNAPLYTLYQKKMREFRVHCFDMGDGQEPKIMVSEKKMMAKDRRPENFDVRVRNHDNGWVFARNNLDALPEDLVGVSLAAVRALGLQFGAVDLGWHRNTACFVFEVNTAPGADNETAAFYAGIFSELVRE